MAATTRLPRDGDVAMSLDHFLHRGIGVDLSSIACHAAIELGGLLQGHPAGFKAVEALAQILSEKESLGSSPPVSAFLLDPSASVLMNQAIVDAKLADEPMTEDEDLAHRTEDISTRLVRLINEANSDRINPEELTQMRDFCLALSRRAFASEGSAYEDDFQSL